MYCWKNFQFLPVFSQLRPGWAAQTVGAAIALPTLLFWSENLVNAVDIASA